MTETASIREAVRGVIATALDPRRVPNPACEAPRKAALAEADRIVVALNLAGFIITRGHAPLLPGDAP